jgi:hypothetical protein
MKKDTGFTYDDFHVGQKVMLIYESSLSQYNTKTKSHPTCKWWRMYGAYAHLCVGTVEMISFNDGKAKILVGVQSEEYLTKTHLRKTLSNKGSFVYYSYPRHLKPLKNIQIEKMLEIAKAYKENQNV